MDGPGSFTGSSAPGQGGVPVTTSYVYDVENRVVGRSQTGSGTTVLRYDPLGRPYEVTAFAGGVSQGPTRFVYDGDALVAEYDGGNAMLRRHVHGAAAGADDPVVTYTGGGTALPAFLRTGATVCRSACANQPCPPYPRVGFSALLEAGEKQDNSETIREAESTGRPLGSRDFLDRVEAILGRNPRVDLG